MKPRDGHLTAQQVLAFARGEADKKSRERTLAHIARCKTCAQDVAQALMDRPLVPAPAEFARRVLAAAGPKKRPERSGLDLRVRVLAATLGALGMLALVSRTNMGVPGEAAQQNWATQVEEGMGKTLSFLERGLTWNQLEGEEDNE